ncbi:MAG TPA: hypothetical protein VGF55_32050 [Gemmataceae bacterium]
MRVEFYGVVFETPSVTFYLWSPWRSTALEHKLFEAVRNLPNTRREDAGDEYRVHVSDPKTCRAAIQAVARVLKGWQEDAEMGTDRRSWRWMVEGDTSADGYDAHGEPFSLWAFLRVSLDRGGPGEGEKGEDVDLDGFGMRIWGDVRGGRG